jgi:hypothetical protein
VTRSRFGTRTQGLGHRKQSGNDDLERGEDADLDGAHRHVGKMTNKEKIPLVSEGLLSSNWERKKII